MTSSQSRMFRTYQRDNVNDARRAKSLARLTAIEAELEQIHAKWCTDADGETCDEISLPAGLSTHVQLLHRERDELRGRA